MRFLLKFSKEKTLREPHHPNNCGSSAQDVIQRHPQSPGDSTLHLVLHLKETGRPKRKMHNSQLKAFKHQRSAIREGSRTQRTKALNSARSRTPARTLNTEAVRASATVLRQIFQGLGCTRCKRRKQKGSLQNDVSNYHCPCKTKSALVRRVKCRGFQWGIWGRGWVPSETSGTFTLTGSSHLNPAQTILDASRHKSR